MKIKTLAYVSLRDIFSKDMEFNYDQIVDQMETDSEGTVSVSGIVEPRVIRDIIEKGDWCEVFHPALSQADAELRKLQAMGVKINCDEWWN